MKIMEMITLDLKDFSYQTLQILEIQDNPFSTRSTRSREAGDKKHRPASAEILEIMEMINT
jgi:hypothetical protein